MQIFPNMPHLILVEIASIGLFAWGFHSAKRASQPGRILEYVMIFFYGIILEELDMKIFKTYHYSPDFLLTAWQAPLSIAFLWAVILAGSMALSDRMGLPVYIRPFMDALLAVWIDLALDAIAIRLKYWTWIIPLDEGWFGVPAGNLYAWMWVAFSYSLLARLLRPLVAKKQIWRFAYFALPSASYVLLFFTMNSIGFFGNLFHLRTQGERLLIFWAQFLIFSAIVLATRNRSRPSPEPADAVWIWSRFVIHLYFLAAYFSFGLNAEIPLLGVVAIAVLAVELLFLRRFGFAR